MQQPAQKQERACGTHLRLAESRGRCGAAGRAVQRRPALGGFITRVWWTVTVTVQFNWQVGILLYVQVPFTLEARYVFITDVFRQPTPLAPHGL